MASRDREGYILIDRNMCDWKWWQKHNTVIVFLWLLMKAQFHDSYFAGKKIERGQVATTLENIEKSNGLTRQEVRTAIFNLKSTEAITIERCSKFSVITIVNYDEYQNPTITATTNQQSNNNHITIKKPYTNKYNKDNNAKRRNSRFAPDFPKTIDEIIPERDLAGYPPFEEMLPIGEGTKRDIPQRVRELFDGDYDAYWRYMQRCHTQ